jgi:hypothetical protein
MARLRVLGAIRLSRKTDESTSPERQGGYAVWVRMSESSGFGVVFVWPGGGLVGKFGAASRHEHLGEENGARHRPWLENHRV